jgi:NADH dehydrogenase
MTARASSTGAAHRVAVTVIDRTNHHLFQLLYQVATGILSEGDVAPPIHDVPRRNTSVVLGDVQGFDLAARRLLIDTRGERSAIPYISLIVAPGLDEDRLLQAAGASPSEHPAAP